MTSRSTVCRTISDTTLASFPFSPLCLSREAHSQVRHLTHPGTGIVCLPGKGQSVNLGMAPARDSQFLHLGSWKRDPLRSGDSAYLLRREESQEWKILCSLSIRTSESLLTQFWISGVNEIISIVKERKWYNRETWNSYSLLNHATCEIKGFVCMAKHVITL